MISVVCLQSNRVQVTFILTIMRSYFHQGIILTLGMGLIKPYASDIINALLNYGYAVLAAEISKFVNGFGLDPYYGFMHKSHDSFQALVYDIIEPFRWLVEYAVYKLAVEEERIRGHITIR